MPATRQFGTPQSTESVLCPAAGGITPARRPADYTAQNQSGGYVPKFFGQLFRRGSIAIDHGAGRSTMNKCGLPKFRIGERERKGWRACGDDFLHRHVFR